MNNKDDDAADTEAVIDGDFGADDDADHYDKPAASAVIQLMMTNDY